MSTELNRAANALFPSDGNNRVGNIKFFRGNRRTVSAEDFAVQLNRADDQVASGGVRPATDIDGDLTA